MKIAILEFTGVSRKNHLIVTVLLLLDLKLL